MRVDPLDPHAVPVSKRDGLQAGRFGLWREGPGDGSVTVDRVSPLWVWRGGTFALRTGLGSVRVPIAMGDCVDGSARTCYSNHPVGKPPKAFRHLKETFQRFAVRNSPSGHPAPTPAVPVCARSLLENGIVRAKSQCGQFTRLRTLGLYVN